jgi:acyl phosphate:glycerol-3-phosphate acyltransferase
MMTIDYSEFFKLSTIAVIISSYIIGSIPTAVWVGKWFFKIDVRDYGSGNAGATNVIRVLGPGAGIPVFIIDVLKGFAAVRLTGICASNFGEHNEIFAIFKVILSFIVVVGHVFPLFAGFRGGKGIATSLGVILALFPLPAVIITAIFLIVLLISHYVSLGSITAAVIFPFINYFIFNSNEWAYIFFSIAISLFVIITHRKNIKRLLKGEETKFFFKKKKPLAR